MKMRSDLYQEMFEMEGDYWWHLGKRKAVSVLLEKYLPKNKKLSLADLGCGTGLMMEELSHFGEVSGIDASEVSLEFCRKRGLKNLYHSPVTKLPFQDESLDAVTLLDVLEHVEDQKKALDEIHRVLKKEGLVLITVPAYQFLFSYWDKMLGHFRRYNQQDLTKILLNNGFVIKKISYLNFFLFGPAVLLRLTKKALNQKENSDFVKLPPLVNGVLKKVYQTESRFLNKISFPFGLSLICMAQKV